MKKQIEFKVPSNSKVLNLEEMYHIEGGMTLAYDPSYCTIKGARAKAASIIESNGWSNITVEQLSAEIWCHSYAYYKGGPILDLMKKAGLDLTDTSIWNSVSNGIDIIDGLDNATVAGVPRHSIYTACFNTYASMPFSK